MGDPLVNQRLQAVKQVSKTQGQTSGQNKMMEAGAHNQ